MKHHYSEEPSKYIPMIRRLLNEASYFMRLCPEVRVVVYWQNIEELQEVAQSESLRTPVLEEFIVLTVDGKAVYERLKEIENCDTNEAKKQHDLKQEMTKARSRNILIDLLDSYSKWENQYGFDSAEKATFLGNAIKSLYEEIIQSIECESFKDEEASFKEDQERIDQARKTFESTLIKFGFSGFPNTLS